MKQRRIHPQISASLWRTNSQNVLHRNGLLMRVLFCAAMMVGPVASASAQDQCVAYQSGHYGTFGLPVTDRGPANRGPLIFSTPQAALDAAVAWVTLLDGPEVFKPRCGADRTWRLGEVIEQTPTGTSYAMRTDGAAPNCEWVIKDALNGGVDCSHGKPPKVITIDPGHGGTKCAAGGTQTGGDTGTTGPTYKDAEHALALSIGLSLRDKLISKGYKVVMTRTTAVCPSLEDRVEIAIDAKADLFVSIHFNGNNNRNANGTEAHTLQKNTPGWQIATSTASEVSSVLGTMNRGPKATSLAVLRNKKIPSILVEVAFLSNVGGDEDIMHRPASVTDAAAAMASSIEAFLNK